MDKIQYPFNENQGTMIKLAILGKMNLTENNAILCIYIYWTICLTTHSAMFNNNNELSSMEK